MKAGNIFVQTKTEREKEIKKMSNSGVTKKNIAALDPKYKKSGRRSKTIKRKGRKIKTFGI